MARSDGTSGTTAPTLHVLRCTEVSQQNDANGQKRRIHDVQVESAMPAIATELRHRSKWRFGRRATSPVARSAVM
jgi:hypothetical protein